MTRIAVFVSGGGSNLQSIIDSVKSGFIPDASIEIVVSNKADAYGLKRAQDAGIQALFVNQKDFDSRESYDAKLASVIKEKGIDLVCLAGYMKILTPVFIDGFAGRIMNIHPSLLPSFGGPGMHGVHVHEAVIAYRAKVSGCTVHFVDKGVDTGPVIIQKTAPVYHTDTPEMLQKRIIELEHKAYPEAVKLFCEKKLEIKGRTVFIK